jgi:hypothetical protein
VTSWIDALHARGGPLTNAASMFAASLGVEVDPPNGPHGLRALARAIEHHLREDEDEDGDRMFVELAGSYLALLLCEALAAAEHATERGQHGLRLGAAGFYDPFAAIERVCEADDVRSSLALEVALAEAQARGGGQTQPAHDAGWALVRARVLPRLIGPRFYDTLGKAERELPLCTQPLAGDVRIAFIVREHGRARYVRGDEAARWDVPTSEIACAAVSNLARCSAQAKLMRFDGEHGSLVVARTGDGLDSSRLLLPGLHDLLAAELGSPFAAAVPHRDALFACSLRDPPALQALRERTAFEAARAPHAISAALFAVGPGARLLPLPG